MSSATATTPNDGEIHVGQDETNRLDENEDDEDHQPQNFGLFRRSPRGARPFCGVDDGVQGDAHQYQCKQPKKQ